MIAITTNNVPRDLVDAWELPPKERAEFDYLPWDSIDAGSDSATFLRYRGRLYDLGEFMRSDAFPSWDGYASDSYFSGIVVRLVDDGERCIVGRYCC